MLTPELQPNTSNLQTLENELSLTKQELEAFRKLPKEQQEKQKQEKLAKLSDLQNKLDQAIQEAIKTGNLDEAKKLKEQLEREVRDLEQQIEVTKPIELPEVAMVMEIIPRKEMTSAEVVIKKLEEEGHQIDNHTKYMLTRVNWKEKLKNSYEIVSISAGELFQDKNKHTYKDIKERAKEFGLDLVPASFTPSIRLNCPKDLQPAIIATEAIRDIDGRQMLFYCSNGEFASYLSCSRDGDDDHEWDDDAQFFFVRK